MRVPLGWRGEWHDYAGLAAARDVQLVILRSRAEPEWNRYKDAEALQWQ